MKKGENGEKEMKKDSRPAKEQGDTKNQGSSTHATTARGDRAAAGAGGDDGGDEEKERKKPLPADKIEEGPVREESEERETFQREEGDHVGKVMNTINM